MKTNKYADLINFGISHKTLMTLSESNINTLHKNLIEGKKEETKEYQDVSTKIRRFTSSEVNSAKSKGESLPGGKAVKMNPDGSMDVTMEGEMSEAKKKKVSKINPWAICTKQLSGKFKTSERSEWSPKQMDKYERCVKAVKQSISEGKDPFEVILENKILSLVEKHIKPKMSKGDLMDLIGKKSMKTPMTTLGSIDVAEDTKEAPVKTPVKTPSKPDKDSPYKPKVSPAPKAKKRETKESMVANAPAPTKPTTKPGTKTPPKPDKDSPYKPKTSPAPKAGKKSMPSWMSFDNIGIKLKK